YEVLSFSLQAHSLSQECIDKLDIFFAGAPSFEAS
ncbi:hypothetical protein AB0W07_13790, partial [Escherichia coli]